MNNKQKEIEKVKSILVEWNPLGDQASKMKGLENYENEAIDILFHIGKDSSIDQINQIMNQVITKAFGVNSNLNATRIYARKIFEITTS